MATNFRAGLSMAKCVTAATAMARPRMAAIRNAPPIAGKPKYTAPANNDWRNCLANSHELNSAATVRVCVRKSGYVMSPRKLKMRLSLVTANSPGSAAAKHRLDRYDGSRSTLIGGSSHEKNAARANATIEAVAPSGSDRAMMLAKWPSMKNIRVAGKKK